MKNSLYKKLKTHLLEFIKKIQLLIHSFKKEEHMNFQKKTLTLKEKINFLKALQEYTIGRLEQVNDKILDSGNLQHHIILQIGIAMNHYFKSLIEALETFNTIAANFIFRSLVEAFINNEYIMQDDTQKRGVAFIFEDYRIRKINIETIKNLIATNPEEAELIPELSTIKKCDKQLEKIKNDEIKELSYLNKNYGIEIEKSELTFLNIEQRAKIAKLKDIYNVLYRQLCLVTHLSSSGLKKLIKFDNNKYSIIPLDNEDEIKKIIPIIYDISLLTMENILKKFNLYIEKDFKAMEDISKKLRED